MPTWRGALAADPRAVSGRGWRSARTHRAHALPTSRRQDNHRRSDMLYWAAVFLVIGLVAMLLGAGGVAGVSMNIAWILFVVGIVMAIIFFVMGRRPKL